MSSFDWKQRFLTSTRGRVLLLLRRAGRTIKELADAMGLAENAVRTHLTALQRYGLVEQHVRRSPGVGKPAHEYRLTRQATSMFPAAHSMVLDALLSVIKEETSAAEYEKLLRATGQSIARRYPLEAGELRVRLTEVISVLDTVGGVMELEEKDNAFLICGYVCPLSATAQTHPQMCKMMEEIVSSMLRVPVREQCDRREPLFCRLEVAKI